MTDNLNMNFLKTVSPNLLHAAPITLYTALGIATQKAFPIIGMVPYAIPLTIFATNIIARYDETNNFITNKHEKAHHNHEILADCIVNLGLSVAGASVASLLPALAIPLLVVFSAANVMTSDAHTDIEHLKEEIAGTLDQILGDNF